MRTEYGRALHLSTNDISMEWQWSKVFESRAPLNKSRGTASEKIKETLCKPFKYYLSFLLLERVYKT